MAPPKLLPVQPVDCRLRMSAGPPLTMALAERGCVPQVAPIVWAILSLTAASQRV